MGAGQSPTSHIPLFVKPPHSMGGQLCSTAGMVALAEAADTEELSQWSKACR